MSDDFMPSNSNSNYTENSGEQRNYPTPKSGNRRARVSLIVDLGKQERGDLFKKDGVVVNEGTEGAEAFPQKPSQQVAVFADLVNDVVDYGGTVGKAHYRLMLNGSFNGVLKGINFAKTPPMDAKGKKIDGGVWALHPQNLLTKLAKATGAEDVIESAKINQLLNLPFMADVQVTEKDSGKKDKDGEAIIYKNVNFKGASKVAAVPTGEQDEDGNDIEAIPTFAELKQPARCVTFANAKKEDILFIRANLIKQIKLALDYEGSNMQKAILAFEADKANAANSDDSGDDDDDTPAAKPAAKPKAAPAKREPAPHVSEEDPDDDAPF